MERLKTNGKFIKRFCCARNDSNRKCMLRKASVDEIKTILDIALNIMKKNIPISKREVSFVKAKRRHFRHILHPKYSLASKRRYLIQKGGAGFLLGLRALAGRAGAGSLARAASAGSIPMAVRGAAAGTLARTASMRAITGAAARTAAGRAGAVARTASARAAVGAASPAVTRAATARAALGTKIPAPSASKGVVKNEPDAQTSNR
jgi:hypothetical protein